MFIRPYIYKKRTKPSFAINFFIYLICFLVGLFTLNPITSFAHDKSQPHFFKINESYCDYYSITSSSLHDFILPQELDATPLHINQAAEFRIEKNNLPLSYKRTQPNDFLMDFGDGIKLNGINLKHIYT